MSTKYMNTDIPLEVRVRGLYPLIEAALQEWAVGKVSQHGFWDFMDYISDETDEVTKDDNFSIGINNWGYNKGQLFLPEDVPAFLKMLHPENIYSEDVRNDWNRYWEAVDLEQRTVNYLAKFEQTTDAELARILASLPVGNEPPIGAFDQNLDYYLNLQRENNAKWLCRQKELFKRLRHKEMPRR